MKAWIFEKGGFALILALIPLFAGCDQERANSAPVTTQVAGVVTGQPPASAAMVDTNQPAPTETDQELADAPGKIISTPDTSSTNVSNNPQLTDFVKLVQAGVGESVLMAYVTNSPTAFNVSSDDILYLNDLGAPETVVAAMLQRDQHFNGNSTSIAPAMAPQTQSAYASPPPAPVAVAPYTDQGTTAQVAENVPPLTPSPEVEAEVQQAPNVSYSYFYDSLSPYGNWVDIEGYGPCWQPTACNVNPGWQPYCDRGHWAYTDCGWCWVSDYSWGWAPFHYGRWFRNNHWGWCWAPDTVWGPAWVSWRYNNAYCGWAPLPPTACYRPGFGFTYFGRSVGFDFGFGLGADRFTFVSLDHFHDRVPSRFRVEHREVTRIYSATTINNQIIRGNNHTLINRGVPVDRVAAASHTEIHPIHVRADADAPRSAQLGRDGRSLSVYRPALPTPRTAVASKLVGEGVQADTHFDLHARVDRPAMTRNPVISATPERRPIIPNPAVNGSQENPGRGNRFTQPGVEKPNSLMMRGPERPDRSTASRDDNGQQNSSPNSLRHGPVFQPQSPAQPYAPAENNRRTLTPQTPQPAQNLNPPSFNRADDQLRRDQAEQQKQILEQQQQQQREIQQQQQQQQRAAQQQQRDLQQQQREAQRQQQQQFQQQQQPPLTMPRQDQPSRSFGPARGDSGVNNNPGFRQEPVAPPRVIESRPAPEVRSAPPQYSAPARQDNGGGQSRGNGGGGGNGNANWGGNGNGNGNGRGNH